MLLKDSMKYVVTLFELGIGLSLIYLFSNTFFSFITGSSFGAFLSDIFQYFVDLFGYDFSLIFVILFSSLFLVYVARWIISFLSNNGGQTPNNSGN